jgi:hypothetical protein
MNRKSRRQQNKKRRTKTTKLGKWQVGSWKPLTSCKNMIPWGNNSNNCCQNWRNSIESRNPEQRQNFSLNWTTDFDIRTYRTKKKKTQKGQTTMKEQMHAVETKEIVPHLFKGSWCYSLSLVQGITMLQSLTCSRDWQQ